MTGLLPDGAWPFPELGEVPLDPREEVLTQAGELLELRARQQLDLLKQWHKERAARLDAATGENLEVLGSDIAALQLTPDTVRRFKNEFAAFRAFCDDPAHQFEDAAMPALPACGGLVATYLLKRHVEGASYWKLRLISAAIADAHYLHRHPDPCADVLVKAVLQFARRNRGQFKAEQQQEASDEKLQR